MGYFLHYIVFFLNLAFSYYDPYVASIVLSWCYNLSVPLTTKIVYSLCPWCQTLCCLCPLGAKDLCLITLPRAIDRGTANTPEPVVCSLFDVISDGFSVKLRFGWNKP